MKFLLLDAHGVLLRVKGSVGAIYSNTAHRHGIRLSEAHVNTHFGDAFRRAPQFSAPYRTSRPTNTLIALNRSHSSRKSYNSSNASKRIEYPTSQHRASSFAASMTTPTIPLMESLQHSLHSVDKSNDVYVEKLMRWEKAWWRRIVEYVCQRSHVDVDSRNFDAFFENVYEEFSQQQTWEIFEDVRPLLERAQTKGIPVGVVSNFDTRLVGLLHDFGLLPYISSVTLSTWCGFAKPDQRIFQQALHDLQVDDPSQALVVGDSMELDTKPAASLGLSTILLDRKRKIKISQNPQQGQQPATSNTQIHHTLNDICLE